MHLKTLKGVQKFYTMKGTMEILFLCTFGHYVGKVCLYWLCIFTFVILRGDVFIIEEFKISFNIPCAMLGDLRHAFWGVKIISVERIIFRVAVDG